MLKKGAPIVDTSVQSSFIRAILIILFCSVINVSMLDDHLPRHGYSQSDNDWLHKVQSIVPIMEY